MPWPRKGRVKPLLPLWAVRPVQSLNACTRVHFTFLLYAIIDQTFNFVTPETSTQRSCEFQGWDQHMFHSSSGPVRQDAASFKTRLRWLHKPPYEDSNKSISRQGVLFSELRNTDKAHKLIIQNCFQISPQQHPSIRPAVTLSHHTKCWILPAILLINLKAGMVVNTNKAHYSTTRQPESQRLSDTTFVIAQRAPNLPVLPVA